MRTMKDSNYPGIFWIMAAALSILVFVSTSFANISVSKFSGDAVSQIPIEVPPGRNGIQPNLALTYSSNGGNGWLGADWSLDMGSIQRSTKKGLNYAGSDYVVRGGELVPVSVDSSGNGEYRAKIESQFTKYVYNASTGWVATTTDGTKYYYGQTTASRQDSTKGVFKWCLDRVEDTNHNFMYYTYTKDQGQIYPSRIYYTGNTAGLTAKNSVRFYLEGTSDVHVSYATKSEVKTAYRLKTIRMIGNSSISKVYALKYDELDYASNITQVQLKEVTQYGSDVSLSEDGGIVSGTSRKMADCSYYLPEKGFDKVNRSLELEYDGALVRVQGDFDGNGLTDFLLTDTNSTTNGAIYNSNTRTYTYLTNSDGSFRKVFAPLNLNYEGARVRAQGDFNGDGLTDFLLTDSNSQDSLSICNSNTRTYTYLSNGDGTFRKIQFSLGLDWSGSLIRVMGDFNGDGLTDFLLTDSNGSIDSAIANPNSRTYSYLSNGDGTFRRIQFSLGLDYNGGLVHANGDFDGDGLTDFLITDTNTPDNLLISNPNTRTYTYLSNGNGTFRKIQFSLDLDFSSALVRVQGDFNGDGLSDFLLTDSNASQASSIKNADIRTFSYLSRGDGTFNKISYPLGLGELNWQVRSQGDFNGDGLTDFHITESNPQASSCIINSYRSHVYYSLKNGTFYKQHQPLEIDWDGGLVRVDGDFNGDGLNDFMLTGSNTTTGSIINPNTRTFFYTAKKPDPSGFPGKLKNIVWNENATSTVTYKPSTKYSNKILPLNIQTVSTISVDDGLGNKMTTGFDYAGGHYDAAEREFRGFETVSQKNLGSSGANSETAIVDGQGNAINSEATTGQGLGTTIKTTFHQDKYRAGLVNKTEVFAEDGTTLLSLSQNTWDTSEVLSTTPERRFVKLAAKANTSYDNGAVVNTSESYTYYTINGAVRTATVSGQGADDVVTTKEYVNYGDWVWRTKKETVNPKNKDIIRQVEYDYFTGTGNLKWQKNWLKDAPVEDQPVITYGYDSTGYGNLTTVTDARGFTTTTEYDTGTQSFPVKVTRPETGTGTKTKHVTEYLEYDYRFGKPKIVKDENGNNTTFFFDKFGRTERVDSPDGGQIVTIYKDQVFPRKVITLVSEKDTDASYGQ